MKRPATASTARMRIARMKRIVAPLLTIMPLNAALRLPRFESLRHPRLGRDCHSNTVLFEQRVHCRQVFVRDLLVLRGDRRKLLLESIIDRNLLIGRAKIAAARSAAGRADHLT